MPIATTILVFVIIWWMVFFMSLPFGVQNQHEAGDERVEGTDPGAPAKTNLKRKMIITTIIAMLLTGGYVYIEQSGLVDFRSMGRSLAK